MIFTEQIAVLFGVLIRQIWVIDKHYHLYTRREKIFDITRRWVFGAFLFFFFYALNIRQLLGLTGIEPEIGGALGGFLLGLGGDSILGWVYKRVYPEEKAERKSRKEKEEH